MSKKDEALELFSQGKGIDDPEVVALGLKKDTVERCYREWKPVEEPELGQTLEEPVEEPESVEEPEPVEEPESVEEPEPVITTLLLNGKLIKLENGIPVEPV